ncbi:glycoside hydrolase family 2 TIM barrel-domain containing protein [Streptomyces acidiscabies]|uniref:glycoside hydrolase family 2 TIM barrel-domain containing protein n=1 Tax=Streptomyces acidiscabies TaxID=42234 RepID=UPI0038F69A9E
MIRTSFNDGWQVRPKVNPFAELSGHVVPFRPVTLPHDAMIEQHRTAPDGEVTMEGAAGAYFPGGVFEYRKTFTVPGEYRGKRIFVEFEGVYRDATVHINGAYAGQRPYGYSHFRIDADRFLRFGEDNEIRVEARAHRDSRWYTGAGIYRDTWLLVGDVVRIAPDGVKVTTPDIDDSRAVVEIATEVANDSIEVRTVDVVTEIRDASGAVVAADASKATMPPGEPATVRQRLYVPFPALWGPETPTLYDCRVALAGVDEQTVTFGIRSLRLDPQRGLRLNGETVKLRGACVHHDNGVLGAATYARAEERRVEILKEAGFNAIRISHQPMSRPMLDACDRLGVLVVDEAFDVWTAGKSEFDYSLNFPEWWERDIEAMVAKDVNHPSVIMYSIGNEIPETGSPFGAVWGRRLAEKVRALDRTRYVTNAVNGMLAVMSELGALQQQALEQATEDGAGINTLMADAGDAMNAISSSELVSDRTAESFAVLDVAGMNYAEARYALDRDLFPNRIILGTETFPTRIAGNWHLVEEHGHVIGDFTWTGWDYLGEVGIGRPQYLTEGGRQAHNAPHPYLVAGCGDIDITGHRRPASYYREIVFGLRAEPYIAVRRPEHHGRTWAGSPWAWSDTVSSWTWPGFEGKPITVEVYSDAHEVELLGNGNSFGRRPVGARHRFRTEFEIVHVPGELVAVAYRDGVDTGRTSLRWADGPVRLTAEADRQVIRTTGGDLTYVTLTLTDANGTCHTGADRLISVEVSGAGELIGFGSADPSTEERFDATEHRTYEGRALAVLRPTAVGKIRLTATAPGCDPVDVVVTVEQRP